MELKTIEHYEILRTLSQGGMSTVYKAHDTKLDRPVALKLVSSAVSARPGFENRFLGSASAISALSHPNIAQVYEAGQCNGQLFLTMEYIDGISLRQRLNSRQSEGRFLELREIVTLARQVAQALHHAHQKGIIHRDIKPDNVMLRLDNASGDSRAVLMDFGLAQQVMGSLPAPEGVELIGTLEYMAPEQFRGLSLDGRTDIYSLGVMLYELISGQQPFRSASPFDLMLMHTQGEPERLQTLRPDTPPSLISIVYRAMLKNPNERYQTAGEIGRELEALEKTISSLNQTLTGLLGPMLPAAAARPLSSTCCPLWTARCCPSIWSVRAWTTW
jgi:serine/threonine-protein kinase